MATLAKPYAVIRRALAEAEDVAGAVEGDAEEEDEIEDTVVNGKTRSTPQQQRQNGKGKAKEDDDEEEEEEEEAPLFEPDPDGPFFVTPHRTTGRGKGTGNGQASSSPTSTVYPSSAIKDYSSELDFSSPPISVTSSRPDAEEGEEDEHDGSPVNRKKRKSETGRLRKADKKQRTRRYEVVGVVRKKVVFALRWVDPPAFMVVSSGGTRADELHRPEPIVTATILPD